METSAAVIVSLNLTSAAPVEATISTAASAISGFSRCHTCGQEHQSDQGEIRESLHGLAFVFPGGQSFFVFVTPSRTQLQDPCYSTSGNIPEICRRSPL